MGQGPLPGYDDYQIPWYALAWREYDHRSDEGKVKKMILAGQRPSVGYSYADTYYETWEKIKADLRGFTPADPEEFVTHIRELRRKNPKKAADAALQSPRSFVQWIELPDSASGERVVLKDFHARMVRYMRQIPLSAILCPMYHGKSYQASIVVPLMDWAEDKESTQIRVYKTDDFTRGWTRGLMHIVENHDPLHELFPHVAKPERGDVAHKDWSTDRFSIKGHTRGLQHPSWLPLTWASRTTGIRADRAIADDWVNDGNDDSVRIQDDMDEYFSSGVLTFATVKKSVSKYGTRWGTVALIGTIFHKQDLNSRTARKWRGKKDRKVVRMSVFPHHDSESKKEVIWPEFRDFDWVIEKRDSLGERAFNMRLCNKAQGDDGVNHFDERQVRDSVNHELDFGDAPPAMPLIIGYDPATSKRTKNTKAPAYAVLGFGADGQIHIIEWGRWRGYSFPAQIGGLIDLGNRFSCPVAVEDNQTQLSYAEQLAKDAPGTRIFTHSTQRNKRDPVQGVEGYIPLFRNGKVIIHGNKAPKEELSNLIREFVDWPQGETTDVVMACWIGKRQHELHVSSRAPMGFFSTQPKFVHNRGLSGVIDISALKERMR